MLDVVRRGRILDRRDDAIHDDRDRLVPSGVDADVDGIVVEVPRRPVPVLAFAAIHGKLHHVAVRTMERLVLVQKRLHPIAPRRDVVQAVDGIAENGAVEDRIFPRRQSIHVDAED